MNRAVQQQEVMDILEANWANVPQENKAVLSGGLAGGGKTTTLTNHAGVEVENYAFLSPDDVKEIMADKGMLPKIKGLTPMEVSALAYEESSYITQKLFMKVVGEGRNIIFDTTMGHVESSLNKLNPLKYHGYDINVVFVDIAPETSLRRSQERHKEGLNKLITENEGYGGRLLARHAIKNQITDNPQFSSKNREIFEQFKSQGFFHESKVFDNNIDGRDPQQID